MAGAQSDQLMKPVSNPTAGSKMDDASKNMNYAGSTASVNRNGNERFYINVDGFWVLRLPREEILERLKIEKKVDMFKPVATVLELNIGSEKT